MTKEDLLQQYAEKHPEMKAGSRANWASQLLRFVSQIAVGDTVVTFDGDRRLYFLGTVESEYQWATEPSSDRQHTRRVKWTHQVPRDALSTAARNTLGAIQTLFKLNPEVADELRVHQAPLGAPVPLAPPARAAAKDSTGLSGSDAASDVETEDELRAEILEKADEFIEDAISRLDWEQMQELVAGILRAMGYRTTVSGPGSDLGVDIFASPDGLGLQEPRIFVEVKHRARTSMSSKEIRAFLGGRKHGDKCLYVSTGGFTKDAHYEAERASMPTTLINLPDLRKLLVAHYEKLDTESRALVPLKRLYWPAL